MSSVKIGGGSTHLLERAQRMMPGGVSSPVRAFGKVGGDPFFVDRGQGATIIDVEGNRYVDYVMSWGALMLGHAHPSVTRAIQEAVRRGTSYGAPVGAEVELAELIARAMPSIEMVRFVNSGTEATMSAVRLARAATGRDRVLKFAGCYHGHSDGFLSEAGSGLATLGLPASPGVPDDVAALTVTVPFNDLDAAMAAFDGGADQIACVIVEPVCGNAGFIPPADGFLEGLRELTERFGALLIFDEVMTGFRVAYGGAQERFGVKPDLTTLGKVIGGGLPVGAYGGRRDLMQRVAPVGPVYQAGTLSGNPIAMAAGIAQLLYLRESDPYTTLEARAHRLLDALRNAGAERGVAIQGGALGAMFGFFFADAPVRSFEDAKRSDAQRFARFHRASLERGVFLPPSPYEAAFLSTAHGEPETDQTIDALTAALAETD